MNSKTIWREQNILSTKQCLFIYFLNFSLTGLPTSTTNWNKSQSNCKDPYSRVNHTTDMCELNKDTTNTAMWTNIFRVEISAHVDHGNSTNIFI